MKHDGRTRLLAPAPRSERTTLISSLVSFAAIGAIGIFVADSFAEPIVTQLRFDGLSWLIGIAATVPPMVMLRFVMTSPARPVRAFRDRQIRLFVDRGLDVSGLTIVAISLGAGIGEEILFRGALQPLFQGWTTPLAGLLAASMLFGLAHAASWAYVAITAVVGLYFGVLAMVTGNLLVPIVSHTVYDIYALTVTVKAVRRVHAAAQGRSRHSRQT